MNKVKEFLKTHRYALIWTLCYIVLAYFTLFFIFGFDMLSARHWHILSHARIRGFAGFAFGILMLAAVPMYVATTYIIIKNKKPLFTLFPKKKKEEKPESASAEATADKEPEEKPLPAGIPNELKGAFIRARKSVGSRIVSDFEMTAPVVEKPQAAAPEAESAGLPIPDNFDFGSSESAASNTPVFKEINFSADKTDSVAVEKKQEEKSELKKYLEEKGYDILTDGDILISNGFAIATHNAPDFWIADDDNWFAAGKQKTSPIADAVRAANKHSLKPVIYLAEKNIMDLDNKRAEWESNGVKVITDLTDL